MKHTDFSSPRQLIYKFVRPYWRLTLVLVLLLLVETGLATVQPLVMAPMVEIALEQSNIFSAAEDGSDQLRLADVNLNNVDQYVSQLLNFSDMQAWDIVLLLSMVFFGLVVFKAIVGTGAFYLFTRIRVASLRKLQAFVFDHLLSLSMDYFNIQRSGEIVTRLDRDTRSAVNSLASIIRSLATAPLMIIFYSYLLLRTNLTLMLLVSFIALAQWTVARMMRRRLRSLVRDEFDLIARLNAYLHEVFQNIRVVKSFAAERFERANLHKRVDEMVPVHVNRALYRHMQEPIVAMINGVANVSILLLSTRELFNGSLTVAGFFLFLYLGRTIIQPISQLGQVYLSIQEMEAAAERVFEMVQKLSSIVDGPKEQTDFADRIQFDNVTFSYGDKPVLNDVNIDIKRGEMVALVGPSGAGKSTLTDLLMRFYDPSQGKISIDGVLLSDLKIDNYRRLFGVVAQENLLFNASIAENIAYGRDGISMEEIKAAARVANADEFIEQTENGYETMVGDRGIRLSGGQRQRIAIARAIVHQPKILILDEATSSLDTESERLVQSAIDHVIQDTTAVVVAHRLSTVIHADKIIVLENGEVLDQGKHSELFERSPLYRRLCQLQFQNEGNEKDTQVEESPLELEK